MTALPADARLRLAASLEPLENRRRHQPAIPVTASGWQTVLADAGLVQDCELAAALDACADAAGCNNPTMIRAATRRLVEAASRVLDDLRLIEAFGPSCDGRTTQTIATVHRVASDALQAVIAGDGTSPLRLRSELAAAIDAMTGDPVVVDDRLAAIFGVAHEQLTDANGRTSVARIIASLHQQGRLGNDLLGLVLAPVTTNPPSGFILVRAALPLLVGPRPLLTLRTAVRVQRLILDKVAADVKDTGAVLRTLKLGIERSAASHQGIMRVEAALADASAQSEVAYLTLDLYRRFMESQVRPWGWALLRLTGHTTRDTPPELGTMRNQLAAAHEPLLNAWGTPIIPAVRNAAAHEDFTWDHGAGALRVGTDLVTAVQLQTAVDQGYSMMIGAESGWACARANSRALARELDAEDPPEGSRTLSLGAALNRFGTNGLHVRHAAWEGKVVTVELDELKPGNINPCFQAVIESIEWISPERFEIGLVGHENPIMCLGTDAVTGARELWLDALHHFRAMPTSVFVALNIEARLQIEDAAAASRAAAWLTLDDAVVAHDEHEWWNPQRARQVVLRLRLARRANGLIRERLPAVNGPDFLDAIKLIRAAETSARATAAGVPLEDPTKAVRELRDVYDALERPLILPTLGV